MPLLNTLENKLGRYAVPHLVRILAGFQVAVWLMIKLQPEFEVFLLLERTRVFSGELWRLVTWIFVPGQMNPIFLFFAVMIMFTIGDALEDAWGAFRLNLYLFGGVAAVIAGVLIFNFIPSGIMIYTTLFLAFAVLFPDFEFLIFFILPVKVKYLGMITGALMLLNFIDTPGARLPIIFSLLNFIVAFAPGFFKGMSQKAVVTERRMRFNSEKTPEGSFFHKCHQCGKTDVDDSKLEFRVTADGEEYCVNCRPVKVQG
ncbi:MAG: hypothetical protein RL693_1152 [Verrucomicrobiota bacterium]|jgi:hypothetical protein